MTPQPHAVLLPLYLELYDQAVPHARKPLEEFSRQVGAGLAVRGLHVTTAPLCRTAGEVAAALATPAAAPADCIVTLHVSYSPSLAAAVLLARSPLPVVICDTTMDFDFAPGVAVERIMYNHGIHGVQDLASVLRRMGKPFAIAAGHVEQSPVLARTADLVRAAQASRRMACMKALRVGAPFEGMGDFAPGDEVLRRVLGIQIDQIDPADLADSAGRLTPAEIDAEMARDRQDFTVTAGEDVHRRSVRVGLALRRRLDEGGYGAFSMNFQAFNSPEEPINTPPFLECCRAMARGVGYAGEGDVLTACLVGALGGSLGPATFTEIFCPDWRGGSLLLSHMGEVNPLLADGKCLLCEKPFPFAGALNPAVPACALRPGQAVLVNLAPGPADTFGVLATAVDVLSETPPGAPPADATPLREQVRGWIRPDRPVAEFLEEYSRHGGTHHSALVMGDCMEAVRAFAMFAGLEFRRV
jgi:L-arabinose isomerase